MEQSIKIVLMNETLAKPTVTKKKIIRKTALIALKINHFTSSARLLKTILRMWFRGWCDSEPTRAVTKDAGGSSFWDIQIRGKQDVLIKKKNILQLITQMKNSQEGTDKIWTSTLDLWTRPSCQVSQREVIEHFDKKVKWSSVTKPAHQPSSLKRKIIDIWSSIHEC